MIRYVPTSDAQKAETLTEALWSLSRPPQVRSNEVTDQMFPTITALNATVWLVVDTEFDIPVHAEAVLDGIADVLQPWIDAGILAADTNTLLAAYIESKRRQRMCPWDVFPQFFKDRSKTLAEMVTAGLLAAP